MLAGKPFQSLLNRGLPLLRLKNLFGSRTRSCNEIAGRISISPLAAASSSETTATKKRPIGLELYSARGELAKEASSHSPIVVFVVQLSIVRRPRCDGAAGAWRTRRLATARLVWLAAAPAVEQPPEVLERQQVHVDAREDPLVHEVLELRSVQVL